MENMSTTGNASKNVLNSDVEVKGNLKFTGELTFDGKLDGEIHTDGTLNLGDGAIVNGNINAANVIVRGKINGNIIAKEKIDIKAKTELFGDIRSARLAIEQGVAHRAAPAAKRGSQNARAGQNGRTLSPQPPAAGAAEP